MHFVKPTRADFCTLTRSTAGSVIASRMPRWYGSVRQRPGSAALSAESRKCSSAHSESDSFGGGRSVASVSASQLRAVAIGEILERIAQQLLEHGHDLAG